MILVRIPIIAGLLSAVLAWGVPLFAQSARGETAPAEGPSQASSPATGTAPASSPAAPPESVDPIRMSFDFANPALTPAAYRIEFDSRGQGHYHSDPGAGPAPDAQGVIPQPFDQQISISPPRREQLLALAHSRHFLAGECESRQHKVAFTGHKTISYVGPEGHVACTFNWSQDAQLMKAADTFLAISLTLEEGRRLHLFYLHDRLSLDGELETLANAVKAGTALELENIAPELEAIASDSAVMKRAQARAAALLALMPAGTAAPSTPDR